MSMNYYKMALEIDKEIGYYEGIANDLNNKASLHRATGKNKDAIYYYERALKVNEKAGNVYRALKDFKNLSKIYKSLVKKEKQKI